MMNKPTAMHLEANFDINQIGETLEWKFRRTDGHGNPVKGRYAGSIYFTVGEQMRIRVRAGGYDNFKSFEVLDCCLITRPQITSMMPEVLPEFSNPSPFEDTVGACVTIPANEFVYSKVEDSDPKYFEQAQKWENYLTVGNSTGRWEFSFVITVLITRSSGAITKRVFVFDPEGEVGTSLMPMMMRNDATGDVLSVASAVIPEGEMGGAGGMPT